MGREETLESIKSLNKGGVMFIPVPEGKNRQDVLKAYNLKCWREAKAKNKKFDLGYATENEVEGIKIKRTL